MSLAPLASTLAYVYSTGSPDLIDLLITLIIVLLILKLFKVI